jgi:hypothetical protein
MGISTSASLIVGIEYGDLDFENEELTEKINDMIDDGELDTASPWYDSDRDNWVIGRALSIPEGVWSPDEYAAALTEMAALFGVVPTLHISPDVT